MKNKEYPLSDEASLNSDIAFKNLREIFPPHWKIATIQDVKSGNEYGQDWLVTVTDESNRVRGREIRIQSKVIRRRTSTRRLGADFKVSTLNYLQELPIPVMIHYFDYSKQCGYWMWLSEWYLQNSARFQGKKTTTVYIPRRNKLDETAVEQIKQHVRSLHSRLALLKDSLAATEIDPHYGYQATIDTHSMSVAVYAKHDKAPPIEFAIQPNNMAPDAMQRLIERGEPISFKGTVRLETSLPEFLLPPDDEAIITLSPLLKDEQFPASLEFLGQNSQGLLFRIPYIKFRLTRSGTHFRVWQGQALEGTLAVSLNVDIPRSMVNISIARNPEALSTKAFLNSLLYKQSGQEFTHLELTLLEVNAKASTTIPTGLFPPWTDVDELALRLAQSLSVLEKHFSVAFSFPDTASDEFVEFLEALAQIVETGYSSKQIGELADFSEDNYLQSAVDARTARRILEVLRSEGGFNVLLKFRQPTKLEILKHTLEFGYGAYGFKVIDVLNLTEVEQYLASSPEQVEPINLFMKADWSETQILFRDFLPKEDLERIDWV